MKERVQTEAQLQKEIFKRLDELQRKGGKIFYYKTHGNAMQKAGLPDIIGSFWGIFTGIELKRPHVSAKFSNLQAAICLQISKSQGKYYIVWDIDSFNEAIKDVYRYSRTRGEGST